MTTEQMNREVAEWLGIEWHGPVGDGKGTCLCGHSYFMVCPLNPDFSQGAGIIRLLEEMQARWPGFMLDVGVRKHSYGMIIDYYIETSYITTPGKLLEAVWAWSKEHPR